jgi:hypothetical protein
MSTPTETGFSHLLDVFEHGLSYGLGASIGIFGALLGIRGIQHLLDTRCNPSPEKGSLTASTPHLEHTPGPVKPTPVAKPIKPAITALKSVGTKI